LCPVILTDPAAAFLWACGLANLATASCANFPQVSDSYPRKGSLVLPCHADFGSLIGRINSLFGRLGNSAKGGRDSNNLPALDQPAGGGKARFCQFFPVDQGKSALR